MQESQRLVKALSFYYHFHKNNVSSSLKNKHLSEFGKVGTGTSGMKAIFNISPWLV